MNFLWNFCDNFMNILWNFCEHFVTVLWNFYDTFMDVYPDVLIDVLFNVLGNVLGYVLGNVGVGTARITSRTLTPRNSNPDFALHGVFAFRVRHELRFAHQQRVSQRVQQRVAERTAVRHTPTWGVCGWCVWHPGVQLECSPRTPHVHHTFTTPSHTTSTNASHSFTPLITTHQHTS